MEVQRSYWSRHGPPVHIALVGIAAALGINLIAEPSGADQPAADLIDAESGPSIADLARRIAAPGAGQDTAAASRQIAQILAAGNQ